MKRMLFGAAALAALAIGANARDDRLPAHSSATGAWPSIPPTIWHSIVGVAARIPTMLTIG
jgi:hypothetical protein